MSTLPDTTGSAGPNILTEKRAARRHRVFKSGIISFAGTAMDCTVRNISDAGAQIEIADTGSIPPSFKLAVAADNFLRRCRMVWSAGRRIGVAFD